MQLLSVGVCCNPQHALKWKALLAKGKVQLLSSTDTVGPCKTWVDLRVNLMRACALPQAIQALQAATQLWLQKPGKAAQQAITGLGHFPAVIQALVQVMLITVCCVWLLPNTSQCPFFNARRPA